MFGKKVYNITNHISDEKAEKIRRKSAKETAEIQAEATKEAARQQYWTAQQARWAAEEATPEYQQRMAEEARAERAYKKDKLAEIKALEASYEQSNINDVDPDAFVKLVEIADANQWQDQDVFLASKNAIKRFRVPTDGERLSMFCDSLERNGDAIQELEEHMHKEDAETSIPDLYQTIKDKTNKAYDKFVKDNPRQPTVEEQKVIDNIAELQQSGKSDAILDIVDIYPAHTEVHKWGSVKGSEANPVGKTILDILGKFNAPIEKNSLEEFLNALSQRKDELKKIELHSGGKLNSDNPYKLLVRKADQVIKQYYSDETEGPIGERLAKKAADKKKIIIIAVAIALIILLMLIFS